MNNQTRIERVAERAEKLERSMSNEKLSDDDAELLFIEFERCVTEIARARAEKASDVRIQADLLQRRMRENLSPEYRSEVVDFLLVSAVADGLARLVGIAD